jgi:hypothetical protein
VRKVVISVPGSHSSDCERVSSSGMQSHIVRWGPWLISRLGDQLFCRIHGSFPEVNRRLRESYFLQLRPWRWRQYIPPRYQLTFTGLHGVISQKIEFFTVKVICFVIGLCSHFCKLDKLSSIERPAFHRGGLGSIPGRVVWDMWWT